MSTLFGQLSGAPQEPPSEPLAKGRAGRTPAGASAQLELGLPGLASDPLPVPAPHPARSRRPTPRPTDGEAALAGLRTDRAVDRAARQQARSDLRALKADAETRVRQAESAAAARHASDTRQPVPADERRPPAPDSPREAPSAPYPAPAHRRPAITGVSVNRLRTPRPVLRRIGLAAALLLAIGLGTWRFGCRPNRPAPERRADFSQPSSLTPAPGADPARAGRAPAANLTRPAADPAPAVRPSIALPGLRAQPDGDGLLIVFEQGLFQRHAQLSGDARVLLRQLAAQLGPALPSWRLIITGHTDPTPVRSAPFADNRALGLRRAQTVAEYLASDCGLPAGALAAESGGDTPAPYPNTTPDLRRKNRTATIRVVPR